MSIQTAKQVEPSFALNFEPEDPSELSSEAASASHSSPCKVSTFQALSLSSHSKNVTICAKTSSVLGSLDNSHGSVEGFECNTLEERCEADRCVDGAVAETGKKTKHMSKRRTKSSSRLENIQEAQRSSDVQRCTQRPEINETRKLSRNPSTCSEERGKGQSGKRTSKRTSRHSSTVDESKQHGRRPMKGASRHSKIGGDDPNSVLRPVRSASFSGLTIHRGDSTEEPKQRTISRKTSSRKKEKNDTDDTAVVEDSKTRKLRRKSSKRSCATEQFSRDSDAGDIQIFPEINPSDPIPREPSHQDISKIVQVRESMRRSLSDLGLQGGEMGAPGDPNYDEDPTSKVGSQKEISKIGKVRKSLRRSLSDFGLNVGRTANSGDPVPEEAPISEARPPQDLSKTSTVRKSLRRSLSDFGLPVDGVTNPGDPISQEDQISQVRPQQDPSKIGKVRKSLRRSLSDFGLPVGGIANSGDLISEEDPSSEERPQKDLSKIGKVGKSLCRGLSELRLNVGGIADPGDPDPEDDRISEERPQKDLSKIGKVGKSLCRGLSELRLNVGGIADPGDPDPEEDRSSEERQQKDLSKIGKVGKSLRRGLSDLRLPVGGNARTPQQVSSKNSPVAVKLSTSKSSEQPKDSNRRVLKRLGSVRRVMKGRSHVETSKTTISPRIQNTKLSSFEEHLTCNLWSDNPSEVAMALEKLSSLCVLERKESLGTLELVGGSAIVGALRKWYLDLDVQIQGIRLLNTIAVDISDRFVEGIVCCGGFEIIMSAMEDHPGDQTLQEFACGSIYTVVNTKSGSNSEKFINDLDGLPVLLRPLLSFPANAEIRKNVKLAFNSMKRFSTLHESLALGDPIVRRSTKASPDHVSTGKDIVHEIPGAGKHPNNVCNISCVDVNDT